MTAPVLSLVLPVYNVAPWLPACLDSIAAQTRQPDEIIAVDDGATDESPRILADYATLLPQMRIVRQENAGLSAARNTGLARATGEWLAFLDSDDRLAPAHCEYALGMAQRDDLDIALFNGWFDHEGRRPDELIYDGEPATGVMRGADWLRERLERRSLFHMVWLHMYRREFLARMRLRFVPPWIHEDVPWTTRALLGARRVRYDPAPLVYYRKPLRRPLPGPAADARWRLATESSVFNARELDRILAGVEDAAVAHAIEWQLVDGGLSIFHKLDRISSPRVRREVRRKLRAEGIFGLLWRHAQATAQRRRIARNWLKSFF